MSGKDYRTTYLLAMQDQAPTMLSDLQRDGTLYEHARQKAIEASRQHDEIVAQMMAEEGGASPDQVGRAQEIVLADLLQFPEEERPIGTRPKPPVPLWPRGPTTTDPDYST